MWKGMEVYRSLICMLQSREWYVVWCGWKIGFRVKGVEKVRKRASDYKGPHIKVVLFCFVLFLFFFFFFFNILNDKKPSRFLSWKLYNYIGFLDNLLAALLKVD